MFTLCLTNVAALAILLGPISHALVWVQFDLDSYSHHLLVLANLVVLCSPIALWLRGWSVYSALSTSIVADISYTISLVVSIGIYRAFLHRLKNFPGPFWARIWVFWKVEKFSKSDFQAYLVIDKAHKDYGNVVRIGPRQLSVNEPAAYQEIYGANSECRRVVHLENLRKNLQSLADPAEHKARRNVWDHGLNAKACQTYLPRLNHTTNQLCAQFSKADGKPVRLNDWCHFYTFDVMGDIGFGRSYGQIESGKAHPAILKVQNFLKAGVIAIQMLWIVNFLKLIPGLDDPMRELKEWAEKLLEERARYRGFGKKEQSRDLMSYIEESRQVVDSRWPMSDKDIAEDAVTLQIAGSDTSYSVLVNMCHYLANYPELQEKIRAEVSSTFSDTDAISTPIWSKLASPQSCPYLDATINEVLRRHAPVLMGTLRETPSHPLKVAGHVIPPNTIVSCPIWTMQYDERCFKNAEDFVPERWLDKSHPESRADMLLDRRGFVPFSVGPMNCAGKYFAYMEIKVFFAKVLRQFQIKFPQAEDTEKDGDTIARLTRQKELVDGTKDYLTQWASEVEVSFQPLGS